MRKRLMTAALCVSLLGGATAQADTIRVQSTTDTVDAGLVEGLLRDAYSKAQPGDTLDYTAVGTGAALTNARNGLADIVITHAPSLESQFVADGFSLGKGRQIFYSDYVIAGPKTADAANIAGQGDTNDAIGAFEDIAAAGDAAPANVRFYSRGDNSGTNVQEQLMWGLTTTVTKAAASNGGSNAARFEPGTRAGNANTYPDWYLKSQVGQAANVQQADACVAGGKACYVMTDRGTLNRLINNGTVTNLKVLAERNTASARGGENLLINPFAAYVVNQDKFGNVDEATKRAREAAGKRFSDFTVSPGFQAALLGFPSAVDPAFRPDAAPTITLDAALPPSAAVGTPITVAGNAKNELPGSAALAGIPVQLQKSTDDGAAWRDEGAAVAADANGRFSVASTVTGTARYRLTTPDFDVTTYNALTASARDLGVVTVPTPAGATPTPTPTPVPKPTTTPDRTKPKASTLKLSRRRVSVEVNEASKIRIRIQRREVRRVTRRAKRVRVTRYRTVKTVNLTAKGRTTLSRRIRALKAGRYRVLIRVTDTAGNSRSYTTKVRKVSGR